jgi:site-specific DNA-adenine methylase
MTVQPLKKQMQAKPAYLGGKGSQCAGIFTEISRIIPVSHWSELTLVDAFLGGGAITMFAKAQGFKEIIANDISDRSRLIAEALLINQKTQLSRLDILYLSQPLPNDLYPGPIETTYCPSVFSRRHAQMLDRCLYWSRQIQDPTKQALLFILIWHLIYECHCFPTSLGSSNRPFAEALDGLRSWDDIKAKRFLDGSLRSMLKPTPDLMEAKRRVINQGIFGGSPVTFHQQDAVTFLQGIQGDIAIMDPPYAKTSNYSSSYALLDEILFGQRTATPPSDFSSGTDALHTLLDAAQHIPHWVITYGNKVINLDGLIKLVEGHAEGRKVHGWAKRYAHLPHVAKRQDNEEFLIIAAP